MNCCGDKRKAWLNETKSSTHQKTIENNPDTAIEEKPDKVFEYTGIYSITIYGAVSGNLYNFKFKGDRLKVNYYDSFAMMAERDLKILLQK